MRGFLVEHHHARARMPLGEVDGGGEADDAGPDDGDVGGFGHAQQHSTPPAGERPVGSMTDTRPRPDGPATLLGSHTVKYFSNLTSRSAMALPMLYQGCDGGLSPPTYNAGGHHARRPWPLILLAMAPVATPSPTEVVQSGIEQVVQVVQDYRRVASGGGGEAPARDPPRGRSTLRLPGDGPPDAGPPLERPDAGRA